MSTTKIDKKEYNLFLCGVKRMPIKSRRWQACIEISEYINSLQPVYRTVYVYGETIDTLRTATRAYLLSEKPYISFSNSGDHITGRVTYVYNTGRLGVHNLESYLEKRSEEGWWREENALIHGQVQYESLESNSEKIGSFEDAVDDFIAYALIPEKGPDYHSKALVGSNLRLPLLEKILREAEEHPINDLIQRGWHIVALEYKGELSMTGELMNRKAIFVMGHPEAQVASLTLNAPYYKKL